MWSKLFAAIEAINALNNLWKTAIVKWTEYRLNQDSQTVDDYQDQRNAYLDAIAKAIEDRDEEKVMRYRRLLAASRL